MKNKLISFILALCLLIAIPLEARYKYNPFTRKLDYYETGADIDLGDLADVTLTALASGAVLYYDGSAWVNLPKGTDGQHLGLTLGIPAWETAASPTFLGLTDTPGAYAGKAGQLVRVNAGANALEFFAGSPLGTVIIADGAGGWTKTENYRVSAAGAVTLGTWQATAVTNTYVAGINQNLLTTSTPTFDDLTISTPVNIYGLSHNSFADYAANRHVVLPNTLANVLSDHNLVAHTVLGLFDASSDVDHDLTTNYVGNQHINWTAAASNFSTSEDFFLAWTEAADHASITQTSGTGTEDQALIYIQDDRTGPETDEPGEATVVINNTGGIWALYLKGGRHFQNDGVSWFEGDTYQKEDVFVSWADAADHMRIIQGNAAGIEDQALIYINDDREGATANEAIEATLYMTGEGADSWAIYADIGKVQFDGDVLWSWGSSDRNASITQTAVAGIAGVPLINIDDDRTGVTADAVGEATIVMNAAGAYAFYVQTGQSYFADDTTQIEDVFMTWADATDHMVISQSAVAGTEDQALIYIDDDRTGVTTDEPGEASLVIDADGIHALTVLDGYVRFNDTFLQYGQFWLYNNFTLSTANCIYFAGQTATLWKWALNGGADDLFWWSTGLLTSANETTAIMFSDYEPVGTTFHNDYLSPTFVIANREGADLNDYAGVVIGERAQADVKVAHYFDFYAMVDSMDNTLDPSNVELAAIFRFGASGSAVPGNATTPGDVLFEGNIEVDGNTWFDADVMIIDDVLLKFGSDADGSLEYDETTNDALIIGVPSTTQRGIILCDTADIAADFSGVVPAFNFPHLTMVDADIDSSLTIGFFGDDTPSLLSFNHTLNINWNADQDVEFFSTAASGENPEVRIYGYDTSWLGPIYGKHYVDTDGKFHIGAQKTPIIVDYELRVPVSTDDVANPPTDAQLDGIFGTPATVGAGFWTYIDDNGAGNDFYHVVSDGTNWWIFTGAKAI